MLKLGIPMTKWGGTTLQDNGIMIVNQKCKPIIYGTQIVQWIIETGDLPGDQNLMKSECMYTAIWRDLLLTCCQPWCSCSSRCPEGHLHNFHKCRFLERLCLGIQIDHFVTPAQQTRMYASLQIMTLSSSPGLCHMLHLKSTYYSMSGKAEFCWMVEFRSKIIIT